MPPRRGVPKQEPPPHTPPTPSGTDEPGPLEDLGPDEEQLARRRLLIGVAIGGALVALAVSGILFGPHAVQAVRVRLLQEKARHHTREQDVSKAILAVRRAWFIEPQNRRTATIAIELLDPTNTEEELLWRERISLIDPADAQNLFEMVALALAHRQIALAERGLAAIDALPEPLRDPPRRWNLATACAMAKGEIDRAIDSCRHAVELSPQHPSGLLNLANLCILSKTPEHRREAARILDRLAISNDPRVVDEALRIRCGLAMQERDWREALSLSEPIVASKDAHFGDRIRHLEILRNLHDPTAPALLEQLKRDSLDAPDSFAALAKWMRRAGSRDDLLAWLRSMPERRGRPEMESALAETLLEAADWRAILLHFEGLVWERHDGIRKTLLARAYRETDRGRDTQSRALWLAALEEETRSDRSALRLHSIIAEWPGWETERLQFYERVELSLPTLARWALSRALEICAARRDTQNLARISGRLLELAPEDDALRNDHTYYSLLTRTDTDSTHATAEQLAAKHPRDPAYATPLMLSLHLRGKNDRALELLESLAISKDKEQPAVTAVRAALLAHAGRAEEARQTASRIRNFNRLLPEERILLETPASPPTPRP